MMRSAVLARLAAAAIAAVAMSAASPASAAAPSPPAVLPTLLSGVWCASGANCLAVGGRNETSINPDGASPLAERWNGKTWRTIAVGLPPGASRGSLIRLSCRSATWCVAVGLYIKGGLEHALAEFWNGRKWRPTEPPAPSGGPDDRLTDVSCASTRSCVAVGLDNNASPSAAIIERWNGAKWARVAVPLHANFSEFSGVSCPSAKFCVATGSVGGVLVEAWNGKSWRRVSAPSPKAPDDTDTLASVSCVSTSNCVAVGDAIGHGAFGFAEKWNGKAWTMTKTPLPKGTTDTLLFTVSCASKSYCAAVGNIGQDPVSAAQAGKAAALRWNGKAWALQPVPPPVMGKASLFFGVSCRSAASCAAVGSIGPVGSAITRGLSGFWNGKTWKLVPA